MDTVLVVDDDLLVRTLLKSYLVETGYRVITAENGRLGVETAKREIPDLIVLDLMMPQMDGFEACALLKSDHSTQDIPVIFLTCINDNESIVKCFNSGCVDYLMKPFECVELLARIRTHIAMKKQKQKIIEINRRMENELEMARAFQKSLIPTEFPKSLPVRCAARFVPAFHLAGDYFDFLELGSGRVGLVMADVCGHGVCASMIAAMLKVDFLVFSASGEEPGEVMSKINLHMCRNLREGDFATAFFGIYDSEKRTLVYSMAGHPPPALCRESTGQVSFLSGGGLPLGCFEDSEYQQVTLALEDGDRLMLYTDGVFEVKDRQGELYSLEKLLQRFQETSALNVEDAEKLMFEEIAEFSGKSRFPDDYTLVLLEF